MPLTPVEVRHIQLRRSLFGYKRAAVDRLLTEIADSFEEVWRERAELHDRLEHLEKEVVRHTEMEDVLRATLVSAERAAGTLRENARQEADLILKEAHAEARSIARMSLAEKERIDADTRRIRSLLRSALDALDPPAESAAAERAPAQSPQNTTALPPRVDDEDTGEGVTRIAG